MTARNATAFPIHVKFGERILRGSTVSPGLRAAIAADLGRDLAEVTVGSPRALRNPASGFDAFCGSGSRSSSSPSSSSSGSLSRAQASRYTSSMATTPSSTPSTTASTGSLSRAQASRYTSSMSTSPASSTTRTSYSSPSSVSRSTASRYTSATSTPSSSSPSSTTGSLSRAEASRFTSSRTTSPSSTTTSRSSTPSTTTRSYSSPSSRSTSRSFSSGGDDSDRSTPVSLTRSTASRYTSSTRTSPTSSDSDRDSSPSRPVSRPSTFAQTARTPSGDSGASAPSRSAASSPVTRATASRFTSSLQTRPDSGSTPAATPRETPVTRANVSRYTSAMSPSGTGTARTASPAVTRANASRFTSSLQTTPSRNRASYPSRAAPSENYASRYAADQQRRQAASQAGLELSYEMTGQPGPTVNAANMAGYMASYAGAGLTAQGVRHYMQNRSTPTVVRNNRYGTAFQNRGLSSPFPQRKFTTAFSQSLPSGAPGATGFFPDRYTPTATNPNMLDLFDSKAVSNVTMTPQLRNYASSLQSGATMVRTGQPFSVNSVTFELGRPRLGNTTVVQPSATQQGFNFVDSSGRPLTPATSGPNAGSIVVNHGPNWSGIGNQALRWGGRALVVADPLVHGVVAGTNTPASAPWHERWTAGITAAAQRADNVVVAGGAGVAAAGATSLSGPGALVVGTGTAVAAGTAYEDTAVDRWVNRQVARAEPVIGATLRGVDTGARFVGRTATQAADYVADSYVGQRASDAASAVSSGWNSLTSSVGNLFNRETPPAEVWSGSRSPLRSGSLVAPTGISTPVETRTPSRGGLSGLFGL
ncbi:hypothetical protein ACVC7O_19055 [Roseobacter sp. A03A-229]